MQPALQPSTKPKGAQAHPAAINDPSIDRVVGRLQRLRQARGDTPSAEIDLAIASHEAALQSLIDRLASVLSE
jgi:hypothetical protein